MSMSRAISDRIFKPLCKPSRKTKLRKYPEGQRLALKSRKGRKRVVVGKRKEETRRERADGKRWPDERTPAQHYCQNIEESFSSDLVLGNFSRSRHLSQLMWHLRYHLEKFLMYSMK